jgi:hypothetical protein
MSKKKITRPELTAKERYTLSYVLGQVEEALSWDKGMESYIDGGHIVISLDKSEYLALKRAMEKI